MAGRFVPIVDLTHDDEDENSHMSDIPLQLPESAGVASQNSASVQTDGEPWPSKYPLL